MKRCLALFLCLGCLLCLGACSEEKVTDTDPAAMAETYVGDGFTTGLKTLISVRLAEMAKDESYQFNLATLSVTVTEKKDDTCAFEGTVEKQLKNGKTKNYSFKGTADCLNGDWEIIEIK